VIYVEQLYTKYRPPNFDEVRGNKTLVASLRKTIGIVHFYLLHGTRGCGKTTIARLIGQTLNVDPFDLLEVDAASTRGIDAARQLKSGIYSKPMAGARKLYIIDECHRLTPEAQDVWLKVLEEPPAFAFFVFCTTDYNKVVPTIRSRATQFQVKPLNRRAMLDLLAWVDKAEGLGTPAEVLAAVCEQSAGVPREALVLLEQVQELTVAEALELVERGTADAGVRDLCALMMKGGKWPDAAKILRALDDDAEGNRRAILGYMGGVAMSGSALNPKLAVLLEIFMDNLYDSGRAGLTCLVMKALMTK
jgi:DNA polymerase-3 subunit gamma/tau